MPKTFKIVTLGCKVNQYESAYVEASLKRAGWRRAGPHESAEWVVVNTCIVTRRAAHQSRQAIRKGIRENPGARVAAVGCYAQAFPGELEAVAGISLIAGNRGKDQLPERLLHGAGSEGEGAFLEPFEPNAPFEILEVPRFSQRARAYLKIQDGCEAFCSYCIVPFARGPYRSLPSQKVLKMLEALAGEGYQEVVLTGIHLGMYGADLGGGERLSRLLKEIGRQAYPLRVRLSSLEPREIDGELTEMVASEAWLCRHFHIPLQSGDDRILARMNRAYGAGDFAALINSLHVRIPDVAIGVDVMAGFPGETADAHANTCALLRDLPISYLHVFPYSARKRTRAEAFEGRVDSKTIKERAAELREIGLKKRSRFHDRCVGKVFQVLAERRCAQDGRIVQGTSDNYLPVLFESEDSSPGALVTVRVRAVRGGRVLGDEIGRGAAAKEGTRYSGDSADSPAARRRRCLVSKR
jgi:threonylcarbamoyladenosine tRNA methylthiotransferase MtaB